MKTLKALEGAMWPDGAHRAQDLTGHVRQNSCVLSKAYFAMSTHTALACKLTTY